MVVTERFADEFGRVILGKFREGAERAAAKERVQRCEYDFSLLDRAIDQLAWKLALTMPDCTTKTIESLRKHKLEHWHRNRETNRAWLALNMNVEGKAGSPAFHFGPKNQREVDFLLLRRRLAEGHPFDDELIREISPQTKGQPS